MPRGGLVFDIGANNGRFTELYLRLGATVVALEPNPVLASAVKRRFGSRRLTVVQAAVGATAGCGQLRIGVDDVYSTLSADWVEHTRALGLKERWAETIAVGVVTLDELVERHGMPHFIKVDVEGFEPEVLRGLSRLVPALSFEFQSSALDLARECIDVLEHVGRREYTFSGPEQLSFERAGWTGAQELLRELEMFGAGHANVHGDVYARSLEI